jgi:HSP20 family molecular chaperone IbpA
MAAESKLQSWAHKKLKKAGWLVRKFILVSKGGWPDTEIIRNGRTVRIEFKAPGNEPDDLQKYVHKEIRKHGGEIYVVDSKEKFLELNLI